jgi:hypothetical protein
MGCHMATDMECDKMGQGEMGPRESKMALENLTSLLLVGTLMPGQYQTVLC